MKSNTGNIMGAMDTFRTPTAEDGICSHCGKYNSELDQNGLCPREEFPEQDDCWTGRQIEALQNGTAYRRKNGEYINGPKALIDALKKMDAMG